MPNQTIFIRKADMPLWQALEGKSEKVSQMLNGATTTPAPATDIDEKDYSLCPHGAVKGFCKKGCK